MARQRRAAAAIVALASALFVAALGFESAGHTTASRLDGLLAPAFYDPLGSHRGLAKAVAQFADPLPLMLAGAVTVLLALYLRRADLAALVALSPPVALVITELALKPLVDKRLGGELAFPSGHATACFAVAFVVAVVVLDLGLTQFARSAAAVATGVILLAVFVAMCIAVSGDHYPTDVLAAGAVAMTTVLVLSLTIDVVADRLRGSTGRGSHAVGHSQPLDGG